MILSHARLPVPTLPHECELASDIIPEKVNQWLTPNRLTPELLSVFLGSRREGISKHTIAYYHTCLKRFIGYPFTPKAINEFLHSLDCGNAKHSYYRAIRALCNWLQRQGYLKENPIHLVDSPSVAKKLLPSITEQQLGILLKATETLRDTCIVSLLFDSGLRLSELCSIKPSHIDWGTNTLRVVVKGNREAKAAFTPMTATLLKEHIATNGHNHDSLFGMKPRGVQDMLTRLSEKVGFQCNPHSFRRGFACHLHKRGLSTLSIMNLGRWSSLDMVTRYTRSITFDDCLEQYRRVNNG
jgi:integrase